MKKILFILASSLVILPSHSADWYFADLSYSQANVIDRSTRTENGPFTSFRMVVAKIEPNGDEKISVSQNVINCQNRYRRITYMEAYTNGRPQFQEVVPESVVPWQQEAPHSFVYQIICGRPDLQYRLDRSDHINNPVLMGNILIDTIKKVRQNN